MHIRKAISVLAMLAVTGTVTAQTPVARTPKGRLNTANGQIGWVAVRAEGDGMVVKLGGGVTFNIQGTEIFASEAVVDMNSGQISLSGIVRIRPQW